MSSDVSAGSASDVQKYTLSVHEPARPATCLCCRTTQHSRRCRKSRLQDHQERHPWGVLEEPSGRDPRAERETERRARCARPAPDREGIDADITGRRGQFIKTAVKGRRHATVPRRHDSGSGSCTARRHEPGSTAPSSAHKPAAASSSVRALRSARSSRSPSRRGDAAERLT